MRSRITIKLVLALFGVALFAVGIRFNADAYRWAGIALVAVAWLLRFWKAPVDRG